MRWKSNIEAGILISAISILLATCTPTYVLNVTLDPQINLSPGKSVQVFLIDANRLPTINQIQTSSAQYLSRKINRLQDSLRTLYRDYILAAAEKGRFENSYQNSFSQYQRDYLSKIKAECFQVQKIANFWQFFVKIYNGGQEQVEAIVFTIQYKNQILIDKKEYPVKLAPNSSLILSSIYLDLSTNQPLQYHLSSYPGGLAKLPKAITVKVEGIKSDCTHFKDIYRQEIARLTDREVAIALKMEEYSNYQFAQELAKVSIPLNQILLTNINQQARQKGSLMPRDTLKFTHLKQGNFWLLACTAPDDSLQWSQEIVIANNGEILLSLRNRSDYFFRVTPELIEKYTNLTPQEPTFQPKN